MGSLPPVVAPLGDLSVEQVARASRHLMLPGVGTIGQRRIAAARVLVIGAGGLGSPVLQYLGAAGTGVVGILDFDTVDLSNLQRQIIHRTASIGEAKTSSAASSLRALNPLVEVVEHPIRLTPDNAIDIFRGYDVIVDGSDNFATRYLANDAAAILGKPYVWGSVYRFDGQVTVFWEGAPDARGLDYRDLHPAPPAPDDVLSCDEAGVLGAVCGTIGSMMATEAIKLITGVGEPLLGRVQTLDALAGDWREVRVERAPGRTPVTELVDYDEFCGLSTRRVGPTIEPEQLRERGPAALIDVRDPFEHAIVHIEGDTLVPLAELLDDPAIVGPGPVVVYCKTGIRSERAAGVLRAAGIDAVSLRGGIQAWLDLTEPGTARY